MSSSKLVAPDTRAPRSRRSTSAAVLAALLVPLTLASLAWACVPQGGVKLSSSSAMPLSKVSVEVTGFPADELVNLRWNAPDGPILASGTGPAFTKEVTVPDTNHGFCVVVARATDEHAEHSEARAVLEVLGSGGTDCAPPVAPPPPPV